MTTMDEEYRESQRTINECQVLLTTVTSPTIRADLERRISYEMGAWN